MEKATSQVSLEFKQQGDNSALERLLGNIVAVNVRGWCWRQTSQEAMEGILARKDEGLNGSGGNVSVELMDCYNLL